MKNNKAYSTLICKPFLGIVLLFTIISLLNTPVLVTLWRHGFDDGTYSHSYLIPFISLYLYYLLAQVNILQFRQELATVPTILFVLSCYLLFITTNAQISVGYWGALLAVFITSVTMLYRFNWYIVFPAAFLIFIFPFWGILVPILQNISVAAVTFMMSFSGVPTYVEAEVITIPAGVFEIAGGCSGLRYVIVSLAISSLFIFLNIRDTKRALLFMLLTIAGALLTNWIRITALILIGEYTNMESSLMEDHNMFGWYLYIPFMVLLFILGNNLADNKGSNQKISKAITSKPNALITVILNGLLVISSTMLKNYVFIKDNSETFVKHDFSNQDDEYIKPTIYNFSSKIQNSLQEPPTNDIKYTYKFNGIDLDGKPSFYNNDFVPHGWKVTNKYIENNWLVYAIAKGQQKAAVLVQYQINNEATAQVRKFKLIRLLKAAKGERRTELHWKFIICSQSCTKTINGSL